LVKIPLIFVLGYYWQVTGVAVAFLLANIFSFVVNFLMAKSLIGNFYKEFLANLALPLAFSFVMVGAIFTYQYFIGYSGMLHAIIEITIGGAIYLAFTLLFKLSFKEIKVLKNSF
jgi:PST family polysaccharide transporter/lipopolysaccharide exporter